MELWASFVLFVFATVLSITSLPLGINKRNVTTISAPLQKNDIFVGTCTPEYFAVGATSCEREFFLAFQLDNRIPCRNQHQKLSSCMLAEVELCMEGAVFGNEKRELSKAFEMSLRHSRKHYCGEDSSNKKVTLNQSLPIAPDQCKTGYGDQLVRCEAPFEKLYQRDRGSHELCGEYAKTLSCKDKALHEYCKDETLDLAWTFEARMNPFCGLDEIDKMEGTDVENGDEGVDVSLGSGGDQESSHEDQENGDDEDDGWDTN
eukprot:Seg1112.3 transcript_id=Seg1112.3/GoldUCD/mRNA.D3Y31 product="hypothetical protein" protein_id=Seg1112.3/GoldUCD/D3Y31